MRASFQEGNVVNDSCDGTLLYENTIRYEMFIDSKISLLDLDLEV